MVKRIGMFFVTAALAVAVGACATAAKAPRTASGNPVTMCVLIDRGIENSFTNYQIRNRNQIGQWMEKDLISRLQKAGYDARLIDNRADCKPVPGTYLLSVKITNYNPGVKAVRMYVGFGAGAASMDTHYELFGQSQKPILVNDQSVGTAKGWQKIIVKIDTLTVKDITAKLSEQNRQHS